MTQIVAFAGKKRSGKNTAANFLHGHVLKLNEVIKNYEITKDGDLKVNTHYIAENGEVKEDMGILDLTQDHPLFLQYAEKRIWPFIKLYHFADALKELCVAMFGLTYEQAYGNYKNSNTKLRWENMPGVIIPSVAKTLFFQYDEPLRNEDFTNLGLMVHEPGYMTAREVLQFVGTEIFRKMYGQVWVNLLLQKIKADAPAIAIVADCRFDNEAVALKEEGGTIFQLLRSVEKDEHKSEDGFVTFTDFDKVIDNSKLTIAETHEVILNFLTLKGIPEFINKS